MDPRAVGPPSDGNLSERIESERIGEFGFEVGPRRLKIGHRRQQHRWSSAAHA
jgi:hypothetical protein